MKIKISGQGLKIYKYQNLIKIRPLAAELFHAARRTDRNEKDIVTFGNFVKAPKITTAALYWLYRLSTFYGPIPVSPLLPHNMQFTQLEFTEII
jgi:hypothetical protein